jgi:class 3 adenylate cyclase/predicted ATPase
MERPVEQIADWLEKLGLEQYAKLFADNDIDVSILRHLSDQDLKDLGVSLGHRRKIFAAVNQGFNSAQPLAEAERIEEPKISEAPERRYVTVLFSDLVGSTALSTRLDPEDLRDVIAVYQRCVAETVQRFDGFVAKFMGDGVLVYFGYPEAHEDDPEQAVRAGLELVAAVKGLQTPEPLEARVGIATGLVVVGDLIGSGASQEQAIVGKTPNLAARLQGLATPGMVVIADSTRKLLGNLFELEDLGGKDLKGISGPERAWAVVRANAVDSRFDALHASGVTELVGRQEELELLLRRWSKVLAGEGQVVLLAGEPGIGKSRLTAALLERLTSEPHFRLRYFCSPQHTDSALYPMISQLERAAGFLNGDTAQTKLDKLDLLLAQSYAPPEDRLLFAELLSLPNDGRYPKLDLTPQQRRERTFQALALQIVSLAEQRPVLMIFEDAHWIDPTSLEALGRGIDRIKSVCVLLIITHRLEFGPPWTGRPYVTTLSLNRFGKREIAEIIDHVTGNKALPGNVKQEIIERTDGIPLFVEEMTKAVLEAASEEHARQTAAAVPSSVMAVPASLHASLMARLDRLGAAKEIAQVGAAIGREFPHTLLAVVARKGESDVRTSLDRLVGAGLLFRRGTPPDATYLFKHSLVQQAAYSTLLREPRRALHSHIAKTLESQFAEIAEKQPELLARHYSEAGLIEKAADLWGKAGQQSLSRSALVEAMEHLTRALAQIASLPATPALRREQIRLQVARASPLIHVKGFAAPETKAAVERAHLLIEQAKAIGEHPDDPLLLYSVLFGHWVANLGMFNGDIVGEVSAQFLTLAEKEGVTEPIMIGHRLVGAALLFTGEIGRGRSHLDRCINFYDPGKHRWLSTRFAHDVRVAALVHRSWALWVLGYPEAALLDVQRVIQETREINQAATSMNAGLAIYVNIFCGNFVAAEAQCDELIALATEKGATMWKAVGLLYQGLVLAVTGQAAEAVLVLNAGIGALRATGVTVNIPLFLSVLAEAYAALGQFDDASRSIEQATTAIKTSNERWFEAEVHRIAGKIVHISPELDQAKAQGLFEHALAVARHQQAKSWELRAAMSLARLWCSQGKVRQARELLAPVYGWFTEGFDTHDLKEAKALLEELAG